MKYLVIVFMFVAATALAQYNPGLPIPGLPKSVGQKTMAGSTSVVISSDQTAVPISGTITASNPSVGTNGAAIPTSSTLTGYKDVFSGLLEPFLGSTNGIRVDGSQVQQGVTGTVSAKVQDGNGNIITSTNQGPKTGLDIQLAGSSIANTQPIPVKQCDGTNCITSLPTIGAAQGTLSNPGYVLDTFSLMSGWDGSTHREISVTGNGEINTKSQLQDNNGTAITLGQKTMASSVPVAIASDQVAPKTYINSAGSQTTGNVSTVITLTPPANAVGFILEAKDANTANMRWAVGAVATASVGQQLQPGRDTGFVPVGANVSLVAESGTQEYEIQWVTQ